MRSTLRSTHYLKAMGISVWKSRRVLPFEKTRDIDTESISKESLLVESTGVELLSVEQASAEPIVDSLVASEVVKSEKITPVIAIPETAIPEITAPNDVVSSKSKLHESDQKVTTSDVLDWNTLRDKMSQCRACDLHHSRSQVVFGVGNRPADWLIIGEAPSIDEDELGEPFVGAAGQLLNQMLIAIGVSREQVFINSLVRCRTPDNRDPSPDEVLSCSTFLEQQIELIQPKLILAVGRVATQNLLGKKDPIGKMRGNLYHFGAAKIPLVPIFHPAYLLRSPSEKSKAWSDLVFAKCRLNAQS